jgi:hypothetical protein
LDYNYYLILFATVQLQANPIKPFRSKFCKLDLIIRVKKLFTFLKWSSLLERVSNYTQKRAMRSTPRSRSYKT